LAKTPRTWTGARTPSGLKRVRQSERRHDVLQPRRSTAKTLVAKAIRTATAPTNGSDPQLALAEAISALDRAAKAGAIHRNAAARRKSRLTLTINAALGGAHVQAGHVAKTTGKAAAAKAAKARIAAGKAGKAKGAQTAAGKARAALSKTARTEATEAKTTATADAPAQKTGRSRAAATKSTAKAASTKAPAKASSAKATAAKAAAKPAGATSRSTSKAAATGSKTASRTKKTD
jgi:ribosomal protein S20